MKGVDSLDLAGDQGVVALLLEKGVDVNTVYNFGQTALHQAEGHTHVLTFLLNQAGLDLNRKDYGGSRALHSTAFSGQVAAVEVLLNQPGVDFNGKDNGGRKALHIAALYGELAVFSLLSNHPEINLRATPMMEGQCCTVFLPRL